MVELLRYDDDTAFTLMDDAATVNRIVRTTPAERLRERGFDEWSGLQVVGHVVALAEVTVERVERAVDEDVPRIASVPSGSLPDGELDPMDLAKRLLRTHQGIVALLRAPEARDRALVHEEWGRATAGHAAAYHAEHAHRHVVELATAFPPGS